MTSCAHAGTEAATQHYLVAFDDTDNLETIGTGHVLDHFLHSVPGSFTYITRHQLFVNELVPYTSHNSAMCAELETAIPFDKLVELAGQFLEAESAEGSDPGLCIAKMEHISEPELLVEWGLRAKAEVLDKQAAYALATRCSVHLSEQGGDGQGVVGALAGVGLRLSGNDGRVRGKAHVGPGRMTVRELLAATGFKRVCDLDGTVLPDDTEVELVQRQVKAIYRDSCSTVPVKRTPDGSFCTLGKDELRAL